MRQHGYLKQFWCSVMCLSAFLIAIAPDARAEEPEVLPGDYVEQFYAAIAAALLEAGLPVPPGLSDE